MQFLASLRYLILSLISIYLLVNVSFVERGVGYYNLFLFSALSGLLIVAKITDAGRLYVNVTALFIFHFICFVAIKFNVDIDDSYIVSQHLYGTSGGIVFAYFLGCCSSIAVFGFPNKSVVLNCTTKIQAPGVIVFSLSGLILYLTIIAFVGHFKTLRSDLFLVEGLANAYQRPASFMIMQTLINLIFLHQIRLMDCKNRFFVNLSQLFLYLSSILMAIISQMLGSNAGTVVIFAMLVVFSVISFLSRENYSLLKWLEKFLRAGHFSFGSAVFLALIFSFGAASILYISFEGHFSSFRIFGFGEGNLSSLSSRLLILRESLAQQIDHSPLMGNALVDTLTTGPGTYQHNILSVLTHLGPLGFILYLLMISLKLKYLNMLRLPRFSPYKKSAGHHLQLYLFLVVFCFGSLFTFFTWMPLWFCLGFLGVFPVGANRGRF